jgi:hypothetical protein
MILRVFEHTVTRARDAPRKLAESPTGRALPITLLGSIDSAEEGCGGQACGRYGCAQGIEASHANKVKGFEL